MKEKIFHENLVLFFPNVFFPPFLALVEKHALLLFIVFSGLHVSNVNINVDYPVHNKCS